MIHIAARATRRFEEQRNDRPKRRLGQLLLQIPHEITAAREFAQGGNRNAAVGTVTVIKPLLQDALGVSSNAFKGSWSTLQVQNKD